MAINVITGSNGIGTYLAGANNDALKIVGALDSVNSNEVIRQVKGMDFLNTFIRDFEGQNGATEGFEESKLFFTDDSPYTDAQTYKETFKTWTYNKKGYILKDFDFSLQLIEDAYEKSQDLSSLVDKRVRNVSSLYLNEFLPNIAYESLCQVPTDAQDYYYAPKGFLRNTVVDSSILKPHAVSTTRNHYKAIESATAGPTVEDIESVVEFMSEYIDVDDGNIIALGTRGSLFKLKNTLAYEGNQDIFARTGTPVETICGIQFMVNDWMPRNKILFLYGNAQSIITKLISPKTDRRGLSIIKDNGFENMDSLNSFIGSYYKIQPLGYNVTGRRYGVWLDLAHDAEADGSMSATGLAELTAHATYLKNRWYRGLR